MASGADKPEAISPAATRRREWGSGYPESLRFSRAREYHLYTPEGRRYLDCILGGGSALLGHNPKGLAQAIKNRLSAGPMVPAPGREEGKLRQAVRRLFPAVRWVFPLHIDDLSEGFLEDTPLWRPFERELPAGRLGAGRGASDRGRRPESLPQHPGRVFLMVPSFPLEPRLILCCGTTREVPWELFRGAATEEGGTDAGTDIHDSGSRARQAEDAGRAAAAPGPNPGGVESAGLAEAAAAAAEAASEAAREDESAARDTDTGARDEDTGARDEDTGARDEDTRAPQISPVFIAGLTKAVHLIASAYEGEALPRKLTGREQDGWRHPLSTGDVWERKGIYCRYTGEPELYEKLRMSLQECGILIPQVPGEGVVLPRIITSHERSLWEGVTSTL